VTKSERDAALQRRRETQAKLKRYTHTRSFNQLSGRVGASDFHPAQQNGVFAKIVWCLIAFGCIATGLLFVFF
jgi:hypothetical protein